MKLALFLSVLPGLATGVYGDSEEWERELVDAWTTIGDCSPETGICEGCGFGAAVVDLNGPDGAETRFYNAGPGEREAPWGPQDTWEIASITKPFTAVATLILEAEGVVTLDSAIGDFLPCNWTEANSQVASVTLLEIIQHQSGFPAQPPDRGPSVGGNPFAGYTEDRLCASLLKLNGLPTRGRYSYSNYAYGTLGYVLTLAVDSENPPDYEDIIKEKILVPLEMFDTSVTYDEPGWDNAAVGCSRGLARGQETIRLGAYETLQGNGALRSTLEDVSKYLLAALYVDAGMPTPIDESVFGGLPPASDEITKLYDALAIAHSLENAATAACTCVSNWCEGLLCPLPNPNNEFITSGGFEGYSSGGVGTWRKSGDTGGYSSRVAYSAAKGRAAVAVDTCGGCGSKGTAGSGAQRAALLLVDGPPVLEPVESMEDEPAEEFYILFTGDAHSHNFPSVAQVNVEVTSTEDPNVVTVALSSSDGTGATSRAVRAAGVDGAWIVEEPIFMGTGWGASSDPFNQLDIPRTLIISNNWDTATYQDMGADVHLAYVCDGRRCNDRILGNNEDEEGFPSLGPPEKSEDEMFPSGRVGKKRVGGP
ncbi:Beta-lactamase [Seminavis robusta]|uniref:Beta-lactamase n=1 Tax=Seminavis robusta TaxID=568900 RepID=A0A9N8DG76_9STRA|nr:Beta-lactamase [Seminavis robusta]|eukprot:Sro77_g041950.1 Beta-lactamase (594) ;mRNA; f:41087-43087